jgi:chitin synthase
MLAAFVSSIPIQIPSTFFTALDVVRAFTHCVTPFNPSYARYSALSVKLTLSTEGELLGTSLALSSSGIDTAKGLLNLPAEPGYRAFDAFYYLNVTSASQTERDFLRLKPASAYTLLRKSGTFRPPEYVPTADDAAAAEEFRNSLKAIGIERDDRLSLISALAGLLKLGDTLDYFVDAEVLDDICEEVSQLLDIDATLLRNKLDTREREAFIGGLYEAIVDWVIQHANSAIGNEIRTTRAMADHGFEAATALNPEDAEDSVSITIVDIPDPALGKAVALRTVFDDAQGINAEMKADGVPFNPAGASVVSEMNAAVAAVSFDLGDVSSAAAREREHERERREATLEKVSLQVDADSYVKDVLNPVKGQGILLGSAGRFNLDQTLSSSRIWFQLNIHPTDDLPATLVSSNNHWSAAAVSTQLRSWRLPEWANRRNRQADYTADFDPPEFCDRYASLGCTDGKEGIQAWLLERGWANGEVFIGSERIWMRESAWWEAECLKDSIPTEHLLGLSGAMPLESGYSTAPPSEFFGDGATKSQDQLLTRQSTLSIAGHLGPKSAVQTTRSVSAGDYGLGLKGDTYKGDITYEGLDPETGKILESQPTTMGRRLWLILVWSMTWWCPSPVLRYVGRMRRPDVRLAWREKVTLVMLIFLINATVVFYIIWFGKLLCPNWNKAWNTLEVSYHQGDNDFWVSHRGVVYDISKFWKISHSDMANAITDQTTMQPFAGLDVSGYISPPLTLACPNLVKDTSVALTSNTTLQYSNALHTSGPTQTDPGSALSNIDWYKTTFLPKMLTYRKGDLVWDKSLVYNNGQAGWNNWFIMDGNVYDITDYIYTLNKIQRGNPLYSFFPDWFLSLAQGSAGMDITQSFATSGNDTSRRATSQCLNNYFYVGKTDYRKTPRCQVQNYMLLAFTIILCCVIGIKFLAALQLGSKARPSPQDKFVICQVPAYTEGEDQLRKGLDSLTALAYDNKRKLICVICDGMIVGGGNDRPTPKIVLDILGVDPKNDPPALEFKSVGAGSEQLNYGKVYSGLYEFEGNVVPFMVVVKVGKQSEQTKSKPGNRGKRDSQILLMQFLNRVHHRAPMNPLELEMFHQINNVIGVDPELYEYLLMVDADTMVKEDSLNRLVAKCADDSKIAGICGETSLQNEERSWWTMIQVYEYFISHHLAKAFESLFGSVTCLPGW